MLRSFVPFAKLFEAPLLRTLPIISSKCYFATSKPNPKNAAPPAPTRNPNSRKPNFPTLPPLEPMEDGDQTDREPISNDSYLNLIDEKLYKNKRSAYAAVERRGRIYHLYDAERIPFGRIVQSIVRFIQGKHSPLYRHEKVGYGDTCVIVNADKMKFTGKKAFQKSIKYHTGYVGHLRTIPYKRMILEKPEQLFMRTIYKMLPKNKLREQYLEKVHIFRGPTHPMTHFLPNFGYIPENYDHIISKVRGDQMNPDEWVVAYETDPQGFQEMKDYKREIDLGFEGDMKDPSVRIKPLIPNYQIKKEQRRHHLILRRYKEHKVKQPKYRDIVEEAKTQSVFIDRDWKYKKLGLHKMGGDEDDPDDD